jgi:hypothetical protein
MAVQTAWVLLWVGIGWGLNITVSRSTPLYNCIYFLNFFVGNHTSSIVTATHLCMPAVTASSGGEVLR